MPTHPRSTGNQPDGQQPHPQRDSEDVELETFDAEGDGNTDDPGDAQRSSKMEPDGDGEEEVR